MNQYYTQALLDQILVQAISEERSKKDERKLFIGNVAGEDRSVGIDKRFMYKFKECSRIITIGRVP